MTRTKEEEMIAGYAAGHGEAASALDACTLSALASFPQQLEAHYAAIPEKFKHWAPPSLEGAPGEHFTAIEHICHVRDIEVDGYHIRFQRTLDEVNPTLVSIDGRFRPRGRRDERRDGDRNVARRPFSHPTCPTRQLGGRR
ncbi:MAG: hypothetical protein ACREA2_05750 [Blastocatellia bacterium]